MFRFENNLVTVQCSKAVSVLFTFQLTAFCVRSLKKKGRLGLLEESFRRQSPNHYLDHGLNSWPFGSLTQRNEISDVYVVIYSVIHAPKFCDKCSNLVKSKWHVYHTKFFRSKFGNHYLNIYGKYSHSFQPYGRKWTAWRWQESWKFSNYWKSDRKSWSGCECGHKFNYNGGKLL